MKCPKCGKRIWFSEPLCPICGTPTSSEPQAHSSPRQAAQTAATTLPNPERDETRYPPGTLSPIHLRFAFQGWPPPDPNVFTWKDAHLLYFLPDPGARGMPSEKRVLLTRQHWAQLWSLCDELDLWSLPPDPDSEPVFINGQPHTLVIKDGLQYTLQVEVPRRSIHSQGHVSRLPVAVGRNLGRFHRALQILAGWDVINSPGSKEFYADLPAHLEIQLS
jgi:hypothetical protein